MALNAVVPLRDVRVGAGRTKIAAPLTAADPAELLAEAERVAAADVDIAEWRVDYLLAADPRAAFGALASELRERLGGLPLLVTVRSAAEGGRAYVDDDAYAALVGDLIDGGGADAVDLELARSAVLPGLRSRAQDAGVPVLVSHHDVATTAPAARLTEQLAAMAAAGADIVKLAVTAQGPRDVLELLTATVRAREALPVPVVTMAMGPAGLVSRLCGEIFGSAITFGSVGRASAPGQIDVARLREVVDLVHEQTAPAGHGP